MFNTNPDQIPEEFRDPLLRDIAERMDAHLLAAPAAPALVEVTPSPVDEKDFVAQRQWVADTEALCRPLVERAEWERQLLELEAERAAAVQRSVLKWLDAQTAPYRRWMERAASTRQRCEAEDPSDLGTQLKLAQEELRLKLYYHPTETENGRTKACAHGSFLRETVKRCRYVVEHPEYYVESAVAASKAKLAEFEPLLEKYEAELAAIEAKIADLKRRIAEGEQ